jgi:hypothetical protein
MKNLLLFVVCLGFLLTACDKNLKVAKLLEGKWKSQTISTNGVSIEDTSYTYTFESCKQPEGGCTAAIKYSSGFFSVEDTISYKILQDGTIFSVVEGNETTISDITEHTKSTFVFSHTNAAAQTIITTLAKSE